MGRGYWLPPRNEELAASDGFFIDGTAVYTENTTESWEKFLDCMCRKLSFKERTLERFCNWKSCGLGQNYFVLLYNRQVEIIAEDKGVTLWNKLLP